MKTTWTAEEYQEYCRTGKFPDAPKQSKYKNKRTQYKDRVYASKKEADRAAELDMMHRAGEIPKYFEQVAFALPGDIEYVADFVILRFDGTYIIEDTKGYQTKEYKLKKKLMAGIGLKIVEA